MTAQLHPIQVEILRLLNDDKAHRFSELNDSEYNSDQFSYHLKQLVKAQLVEKDNGYRLTNNGKREVLAYDRKLVPHHHQRISIQLVIQKEEKYVIQHRQQSPFKDYWEFPTAKIVFGSEVNTFVMNVLKEETDLTVTGHFKGIVHKIEKLGNQTLFDDKYFLVYHIQNVAGQLKPNFEEGSNHWLTLSEMQLHPTHFDLTATLAVLKNEIQAAEVHDEAKGY
jgi:ADP-ribose pyrophosphatase YjhB (NUDIX family)